MVDHGIQKVISREDSCEQRAREKTGKGPMKDQLLDVWEVIHSSFWFVPTLLAVLAVALAYGAVTLDRNVGSSFAASLGFVWSGGAAGARSLLSTIAGSMITVAGTVFSITIVALTLASSQFGPRLLRNFVRDTGVQITLGTFTATFLYCILVLRTVRSQDEGAFIPSIAITVGIGLAIISLGVLIFFIHHVSVSIQAESLIAKIGKELHAAIDEHFPATAPFHSAARSAEQAFEQAIVDRGTIRVESPHSGYVLSIDVEELITHARQSNTLLILHCSPGDFMLRGDCLVEQSKGAAPQLAQKDCKSLSSCFKLGKQRTEEQDVRYGARQLAEIASRALSPGINDPYTAMGCLDWMSAALARVLDREPPLAFLKDADGTVRLKQNLPAFQSLCLAMIEPIISYGLDSEQVASHTMEVLSRVIVRAKHPPELLVLKSQLFRISTQLQVLLKDQGTLTRLLAESERLQHYMDGRLGA